MQKLVGVYAGTVENNIDPLNRGRLQIRVFEPPEITSVQLPWYDYNSPLGGFGAGIKFTPQIGSIVNVMYRNGDIQSPIWIGVNIGGSLSKDAMPPEAKETAQQPFNQIVRSIKGHTIELDDREIDSSGSAVSGVRITSGGGNALSLSDATGIIELRNGSLGGSKLSMSSNGITLSHAKGAGLYFSQKEMNSALLTISDDKGFVRITPGETRIQSLTGDVTVAGRKFQMETTSGILQETSGNFELNANSVLIGGGTDVVLGAGGKLRMDSLYDTVMSVRSGNFVIDARGPGGLNMPPVNPVPWLQWADAIPAPFSPPLTTGNIILSTSVSEIMMLRRMISPPIPNPASRYNMLHPGSITMPDPGLITTSRMGMDSLGAIHLESHMATFTISGIPIPGFGTNLPLPGLGKMIGAWSTASGPPALALQFASPPGITPQRAVLGNNMFWRDFQLYTILFGFFASLIASAPVSTLTLGVLPSVLNPAVVATSGLALGWLTAQLIGMMIPGNPLNVLSNFTFVS